MSVFWAGLTINLDNSYNFEPKGFMVFILPGSAESARSVLSVISGAMIGVASTVFSLTLVALTLAYAQFGSQLLKNFMHERINQIVLGAYISSYIYCLIVLNVIKESDSLNFVPAFSVLVAIIFSVGNIILLIFYVHNISISIQSEKVVAKVYDLISRNIQFLFFEEQVSRKKKNKSPDLDACKKQYAYCQKVKADKSGYLEFLNFEALYNEAGDMDVLLIIHYKIGDFVVNGLVLMEVYTKNELSESDLEKLYKYFIIKEIRTFRHDAEYSFHQIVQIAARALSPGINDPFTAIACIDKLAASMCKLTQIEFLSAYQFDKDDNLRIVSSVITFEDMMGAAYNQIRQYSAAYPAVCIRMMEAFVIINQFAHTDPQKESVKKHAKMVYRMAQNNFEEPNDLKDIKAIGIGLIEEE